MAEQITSYWPQIVAIVGVIVMFVKLKSAVGELRKDVDDMHKRDTYTQVVKLMADLDSLRASTDEKTKSLFSLWNAKMFKDG